MLVSRVCATGSATKRPDALSTKAREMVREKFEPTSADYPAMLELIGREGDKAAQTHLRKFQYDRREALKRMAKSMDAGNSV